MKNKFLSLILLVLSSFLNLYYQNIDANRLIVDIEPDCGKLKDHRINMTGNGFNKDGNVYWEFIKSDGYMDYYGYYDTNATGGFNDYTIADGLYPDTYTLRFFDDKNNDYIKDTNGLEMNLTYMIPCSK